MGSFWELFSARRKLGIRSCVLASSLGIITLTFSMSAIAQGQMGEIPATYCKLQADSKQEVRSAADLKSDQLRRNNRTFYAAIEIGGIDVKGELYEIHDWSPSRSDLIIPCPIPHAKVKISFRNIPNDLEAQAEDIANAVSTAIDRLNSYRPRILKVMAGSAATSLGSNDERWSDGRYWNNLVNQIRWKTGVTAVSLDRQQELLYSLITDIHLPKLDACASGVIWESDVAGEARAKWAEYCRILICGDKDDGSNLTYLNTAIAKSCPKNKYYLKAFNEQIEAQEKKNIAGPIQVSPTFHQAFSKYSLMERVAVLNAALKAEQANYLYANIGTSGIVFGTVAESFFDVDALPFAGINLVKSKLSKNLATSIDWQLLEVDDSPKTDRKDVWLERNKGRLFDKKGIRIVGSGAWTLALLTDLSSAMAQRGSLASAPVGEVAIPREKILERSDVLAKALLTQGSNVIGCAKKHECKTLFDNTKRPANDDFISPESWIDQQLRYMKSARLFDDPDRLAVSLRVTSFFLDGIAEFIGKEIKLNQERTFIYPTSAEGNWIRGYVATLDPRNEPAIRR